MSSKRISLTKSMQQEIAFTINRHFNDLRIYMLKLAIDNRRLSAWKTDEALEKLDGDILAGINEILGINGEK